MSEQRFACPHCGQHYAAEAAWHQEPMACTTCGRTFQPGALAPPGSEPDMSGPADSEPEMPPVPAAVAEPVATRRRIMIQAAGRTPRVAGRPSHFGFVVLGWFTPILLLIGMSFGFSTSCLAIVVCPFIGYFLSLKLCQWAGGSGGRPALKRYVTSALLGFLFWGGLLAVVIWLISESPGGGSEGPELVLGFLSLYGLLALGVGLVCWVIAAARYWLSASPDDRPSFP